MRTPRRRSIRAAGQMPETFRRFFGSKTRKRTLTLAHGIPRDDQDLEEFFACLCERSGIAVPETSAADRKIVPERRFCLNCKQIVELDVHGRCPACGSDATVTAAGLPEGAD